VEGGGYYELKSFISFDRGYVPVLMHLFVFLRFLVEIKRQDKYMCNIYIYTWVMKPRPTIGGQSNAEGYMSSLDNSMSCGRSNVLTRKKTLFVPVTARSIER